MATLPTGLPATVYETVQIGPESTATPGTAVAATRRLGSLSIQTSYAIESEGLRPAGYKYDTVGTVNTDSATGSVGGRPTYTEAPYAFASVIRNVNPTTPGGGTLTRDWLFDSSTGGADTPRTYSIEEGSDKNVSSTVNFLITQLGLTFGRTSGLAWSGAAIGKKRYDDKLRYIRITGSPTGGSFTITVGAQTTGAIAYNASASTVQTALEALSNIAPGDVVVSGGPLPAAVRIFWAGAYLETTVPTISTTDSLTGGTSPTTSLSRLSPAPTEYPLIPIQGKQLDLYVADTYAGLAGASKVTTAFAGSWQLQNRWGPAYFVNSAEESWSEHVELLPTGQMTLRVAAGGIGKTLLSKIRQNQFAFIRLLATGPEIETGFNYTLQIDQCLNVLSPGDKVDEGGLVANEFTGNFAHDATWGKSFEVFVRNQLTGL